MTACFKIFVIACLGVCCAGFRYTAKICVLYFVQPSQNNLFLYVNSLFFLPTVTFVFLFHRAYPILFPSKEWGVIVMLIFVTIPMYRFPSLIVIASSWTATISVYVQLVYYHVSVYYCNIPIIRDESWTIRKTVKKLLAFEICGHRRVLKFNWVERQKNEEMLPILG